MWATLGGEIDSGPGIVAAKGLIRPLGHALLSRTASPRAWSKSKDCACLAGDNSCKATNQGRRQVVKEGIPSQAPDDSAEDAEQVSIHHVRLTAAAGRTLCRTSWDRVPAIIALHWKSLI